MEASSEASKAIAATNAETDPISHAKLKAYAEDL